jgi:phenylpropionate dioxygenase-like ring-hydroxylating dioxygenase large terminal subunit
LTDPLAHCSAPLKPSAPLPCARRTPGEIEFQSGHFSVFENAIDMAHIHYLHNDTFGNQDQPLIEGMNVTTADDDMSIQATFK